MSIKGYLGIDVGTQGLSIIFCDKDKLHILATGEGDYEMLSGRSEEHTLNSSHPSISRMPSSA